MNLSANAVSVRPATTEDLPQILTIEAKANPIPWSQSSFAQCIDKPNLHFWVVTDDETDSIVFAFVIFGFVADEAHIQEIAVESRMRTHGFGAYLMRQIISYVLRNKGVSIHLEVRKSNAHAIQFYQHLGFIIVHSKSNYYSDGEDAYSMSFRLRERAEAE